MRYIVRTVAWDHDRLDNVEVLKQSIPELEIHIDHHRDGYRSFLEVCEKIHDTGAVLLEDDVGLCSNFQHEIESVINNKGKDKIYNFFEKPKCYLETSYVGGSQFLWMQCIYLPPGVPGKIVQHYQSFKEERPGKWYGMATDCLIAYTLTKEKFKYWRIRPCLVQHLPFKSVIGNRPINRQSPYFIENLRAQGVNYEDIQPPQ